MGGEGSGPGDREVWAELDAGRSVERGELAEILREIRGSGTGPAEVSRSLQRRGLTTEESLELIRGLSEDGPIERRGRGKREAHPEGGGAPPGDRAGRRRGGEGKRPRDRIPGAAASGRGSGMVLKVIDSSEILERLGVEYELIEEGGETPRLSEVRFRQEAPTLLDSGPRGRELAARFMYEHQLRVIEALKRGKNVIMISGTGSGKTEAWAVYALEGRRRTLAIYPTLALSRDQTKRLEDYFSALGPDSVFKAESSTVTSKATRVGERRSIIRRINRSRLVITNPAFLMQDLKRMTSEKSFLERFLRHLDLLVIDELDFYGSSGATLLVHGVLRALMELVCAEKRPQVVVLAATLGGAEELAEILTELNGRETEISRGSRFGVPNRRYLILDPRSETIVPRLLAEYAGGDGGVTLVFTSSIREAEELARKTRELLPAEIQDRVCSHHHLIDRAARGEIERKAARGEVKVIVTPRTLLQGIDIGTVVRIVHYGLPMDVREYHQREGRKGRRREIPFSESLIFPVRRWGRKLLESGAETLSEWIDLPKERLSVVGENKYARIFLGLLKLRFPIPEEPTDEERYVLESLNLAHPSGGDWRITDEGERAWKKLQFYGYEDPYGARRRLVPERIEVGDEISKRDVVEKLQPGCFDPSTGRIVVGMGRYIKEVLEADVGHALRRSAISGPLSRAVEDYNLIKLGWGEEPDFLHDLLTGRIQSYVELGVSPPRGGFGPMVVRPLGVRWIVESRTQRVVVLESGEERVIHPTKVIELEVRPRGSWLSYTYGESRELDPEEDANLLRVGLAYLLAALRLSKGISPREIRYAVWSLASVRELILWEPEPIGRLTDGGLLEDMAEALEVHRPGGLTESVMWAVDRQSAELMLASGMSWDEVRRRARRALDYLLSASRISLPGRTVRIRRPGEHLRLAAISLLPIELPGRKTLAISMYPGSEPISYLINYVGSLLKRGEPVEAAEVKLLGEGGRFFAGDLERFLERGFRILHFGGREVLRRVLGAVGVDLDPEEFENRVVDVHREVIRATGVDAAPMEELEGALDLAAAGFRRRVSRLDVMAAYLEAAGAGGRERAKSLMAKSLQYVRDSSKSTYLLHLAAEALIRGSGGEGGRGGD